MIVSSCFTCFPPSIDTLSECSDFTKHNNSSHVIRPQKGLQHKSPTLPYCGTLSLLKLAQVAMQAHRAAPSRCPR